MRPKIFVSQPIPEPALAKMREYAEVEVFPWSHREISVGELESAARRSDYIFCMHSTPITASMVEANPHIKGYGITHRRNDVQDLEAIDAAGVPLLEATPAPELPWDQYSIETGYGLNARATSDLMVAHILNLAYRVVEADRYCRAKGGYFQEMTMDLMGIGVTGRTVALYGLGKVARQAVRKLKALDMNVIYTKRTRLSEAEEAELGIEWVASADELIARGDFVCLLTNVEDANLTMMGAREFALMKPTAYFINVARGRLIDEDALVEALQNGTIAGAGLDVFITEPPLTKDPYVRAEFRAMDNVTLTPHNGGATYDSRGAQTLTIANAIIADILSRQAAG